MGNAQRHRNHFRPVRKRAARHSRGSGNRTDTRQENEAIMSGGRSNDSRGQVLYVTESHFSQAAADQKREAAVTWAECVVEPLRLVKSA